ncbi:MAG: hypothetical protein ACLTTP_04130 [Alistipes ihumii]
MGSWVKFMDALMCCPEAVPFGMDRIENATTDDNEYPMLGIANVIEDADGTYQSTMDHAVVRIWDENSGPMSKT